MLVAIRNWRGDETRPPLGHRRHLYGKVGTSVTRGGYARACVAAEHRHRLGRDHRGPGEVVPALHLEGLQSVQEHPQHISVTVRLAVVGHVAGRRLEPQTDLDQRVVVRGDDPDQGFVLRGERHRHVFGAEGGARENRVYVPRLRSRVRGVHRDGDVGGDEDALFLFAEARHADGAGKVDSFRSAGRNCRCEVGFRGGDVDVAPRRGRDENVRGRGNAVYFQETEQEGFTAVIWFFCKESDNQSINQSINREGVNLFLLTRKNFVRKGKQSCLNRFCPRL